MRGLDASFAFGKVVHEGLTLAIVGRPNVGKSSLFNRLVERERAIVTALPGTTRDLVTETVALGGIPVRLVDTAGIREALDEAEHIGIRKSMEALADADLVLVVLDASAGAQRCGSRTAGRCRRPRGNCGAQQSGSGRAQRRLSRTHLPSGPDFGGDRRRNCRITRRDPAHGARKRRRGRRSDADQPAAARPSPIGAGGLAAAAYSVQNEIPHEMVLLDLYHALRAFDELTGATTADDILNLIFSTFCIGK